MATLTVAIETRPQTNLFGDRVDKSIDGGP
jgi:hypothetical protein